jgi:hypothetical protein
LDHKLFVKFFYILCREEVAVTPGRYSRGEGVLFMVLSSAQVKKLLEYSGTTNVKQLAVNIALTRYKMQYQSAPAKLNDITAELNALLNKLGVLADPDVKWITSL